MEDISNGNPAEDNEKAGAEISIPENVFLVFQGVKAFPLNQAVTSIGRSHDNTIVIDDPRISRHHLEIRVIQESFMVFDLHSSGGTYVNGKRITQGLLYPGDLISLAGVNLVFVHDRLLPGRGNENTTSIGPGVHSTAIFNPSMSDKDITKKKDQ